MNKGSPQVVIEVVADVRQGREGRGNYTTKGKEMRITEVSDENKEYKEAVFSDTEPVRKSIVGE